MKVRIAAAKGLGKQPNVGEFSIPLLNRDNGNVQQIVGTGERFLYLEWAPVTDNLLHTVTVKRQGSLCREGSCWKAAPPENFTSMKVNLGKGIYQVTVTAGNQSATGIFKVVTSHRLPHSTRKQQEDWAVKLLKDGKNSKWTLEAYQIMARMYQDVSK